MNRKLFLQLALASLSLSPGLAFARDLDGDTGAVYTMDNGANGNHIFAYRRAADGTLAASGSFATGGAGTGAGLGDQAGIVLSRDGRWLFVCNAGSDEISAFRVTPRGLQLTDTVSSGGKHPLSLALHHNLLYVLNAGGQAGDRDNVTGFLTLGGRLHPCPASTRPLSADDTGPAQISFSAGGDVLVVTEKNTSLIDTYTVDENGLIADHKQFASRGQTPFGFAFHGDDLLVSEAFGGAAGASAVSSYELDGEGNLTAISPSVPTTETAACWVAVSGNGRFAFAANTGSGSISAFRVARDGSLQLRDADGVTGTTGAGSKPADLALSSDGRYLYCRSSGTDTISAFRVNANGSLTSLAGVGGLPVGASGLVAE